MLRGPHPFGMILEAKRKSCSNLYEVIGQFLAEAFSETSHCHWEGVFNQHPSQAITWASFQIRLSEDRGGV